MKVGDQFPITIQGIPVGLATVAYIESDQATLVFEGQKVVFRTRTELTDEGPDRDSSGTQRIVDEVVRQPETNTVAEVPVTQNPDPVGDNTAAPEQAVPETPVQTKEEVTQTNESSSN
jgi:hypothetical protein